MENIVRMPRKLKKSLKRGFPNSKKTRITCFIDNIGKFNYHFLTLSNND